MSASEWPNVTALVEGRGLTVPALDKKAAPYPPDWLRERSERYASDPEMAGLLDMLASYPALNNKLNRESVSVRNQNIALHYMIACELEPKKIAARQRVADLWLIAPATVKDIAIEHRATASTWLLNFIAHIDARSDFATRHDILRALDADMIMRAPTF
jgi:hypothetical protein